MSTSLNILVGFISLIVILFVREFINELGYKKKSKKYGTKLPVTILDRPFGFPSVVRLRNAQAKNETCQFFLRSIDGMHLTVRAQTTFDMNIVTVDPENIKTVLATNFKDYSLGIRYSQLYPLLGNGIFTLSGEGWKHSRSMLRPQFARDQVSQLDTLRVHVQQLLDNFKAKSKNGREFFDAQVQFHCLTIDTASEFLFGESTDSLSDSNKKVKGPTRLVSATDFAEHFNAALDVLSLRTHVGPLYWLIDGFKFRKSVSICKNFVDYFVLRALENPHEKGEATSGRYVFINELAKETRDAVVIRDQAFNILLAGRDTTASLLSFIIFYLARDKRVWNALRQAVLEDFGTSVDSLTFESLKRCVYLNHVINEVLRLHPIVPINFRTAVRDTILPRGGGPNYDEPVLVPKGTKVVYTVYTTQRLEQFWGKDAEEFRPERWGEGKPHTWDFLPFNGGPRICLGQQFALTETGFTIVRIIQTFKDILYEGSPSYENLAQWTKLTASVANGVKVSFVE